MNYFAAIITGYLFGCIQTAYLSGKLLLGKDIRELGNGNAGASNATVEFGRGFGIAIAIVDILKGAVAIVLIRMLFGDSDQLVVLEYLAGGFAVIGHNFPFYMGFRGGKGTATAVGVLFGFDWRLGLSAVVVMFLVVLISDYIVVGTMALLVLFVGYTIVAQPYPLTIGVALVLALMSVYKHRENFVKIRQGTEKKVRSALFKGN